MTNSKVLTSITGENVIAQIKYEVSRDSSARKLFSELNSLFPNGGYTATISSRMHQGILEDVAVILVYDQKVLNYYKFFFPDINIVEY